MRTYRDWETGKAEQDRGLLWKEKTNKLRKCPSWCGILLRDAAPLPSPLLQADRKCLQKAESLQTETGSRASRWFWTRPAKGLRFWNTATPPCRGNGWLPSASRCPPAQHHRRQEGHRRGKTARRHISRRQASAATHKATNNKGEEPARAESPEAIPH